MPPRLTPLTTGEYYHIYNRGVNKQAIFSNDNNYNRFIKTSNYYQHLKPSLSLSRFLQFQSLKKQLINSFKITNSPQQVEIIAYVLMPNHYHFIIKQLTDNGISEFIRLLGNSYTRYFNTCHNRVGPVFQGPYKAKLISDNLYLLQLSRYIHLNPYVAGLVTLDKLINYQYSSLPQYLAASQPNPNTINPDIVLNQFNPDKLSYKDFCLNTSDYSDSIPTVSHLLLDE
jgi:putative transposase